MIGTGQIANFEFLGDRPDTRHAPRGAFRDTFFRITSDMPDQGHNTASHSHADMRLVDPRLPSELIEDFLLQGLIHDRPSKLPMAGTKARATSLLVLKRRTR